MNAQSLLCNIDEIKLLIREMNYDVLCISETWLESNIPDAYIVIPGFNVYRCDYGRGGGSCIFYRDDLKVTLLETYIDKVEGVEDVWVSVQSRKLPSVVIGSVYRHPKASVISFDYMYDVFKKMCMKNKPIFIFGDINDDMFIQNNKLSKLIKGLNLMQIIDKPTRITSNSSTLIDVIITNRVDLVLYSDVIPSPIADHELLSLSINIKKPKREKEIRTFRCLTHYSPDTLCSLLLNRAEDLNTMLNTDDVNIQVETFTEIFKTCLDNCAPVVTKEVSRPSAPWINEQVKQLIKNRNDLQNRLKKDKSNLILRT